ncbi:cysteine hydrolase family protein [Methylorubrum rhodesianum]|jgi:nicotinamidase-related amidase|uniref:Cysteine hydrolase family protein n=1 Tax=Methylorubrum rhodesianum TaxID=29427 RepID=A0ABU9ZJF4_9HYPH|nr:MULTISPECIES: cysteine hydrolase family protein [Methylorubrum]MBB5762224.1 nicotinamidase-related amidase [Methylorubrum rhodesianum]MBI1688192.1 cysteine hydrolase family protein [Methylorubrum sp. DB1722]MBK3405540.1 cysteine hydrolase family protein [Methylorubrum rhodesianum]MBY0139272.1 cysteine hydrolase family protein [Methylorubrum populi]
MAPERQALLVVDVQASFGVPEAVVAGIAALGRSLHTVATVERHDEAVTPFARQLGWTPPFDEAPLVPADRLFVKHGYLPPPALIEHFRALGVERVLVCGVQAETCCLAAGFMLFDAGLQPTLLRWLSFGSSLDRSAALGAALWRHHFGSVLDGPEELQLGLEPLPYPS